jgi:hypothetical protein
MDNDDVIVTTLATILCAATQMVAVYAIAMYSVMTQVLSVNIFVIVKFFLISENEEINPKSKSSTIITTIDTNDKEKDKDNDKEKERKKEIKVERKKLNKFYAYLVKFLMLIEFWQLLHFIYYFYYNDVLTWRMIFEIVFFSVLGLFFIKKR